MSLCYGYSKSEVQSNKDFENYYRITNLPDPTTDDQPVTKGYADKHYSGGGIGGDTYEPPIKVRRHYVR